MKTAQKYKNFTSRDQLPAMLRVKDCAEFLGINVNSMYSVFHSNSLKTLKIGGRYMVSKKEFLRWIDEQSQ